VTITSKVTSLVTLTPPPVTVASGKQTANIVTVKAPTPTLTMTRYIIATVNAATKTINYVYTIHTTTTPAAIASACTAVGGVLY
jgi:hypothetical protein